MEANRKKNAEIYQVKGTEKQVVMARQANNAEMPNKQKSTKTGKVKRATKAKKLGR